VRSGSSTIGARGLTPVSRGAIDRSAGSQRLGGTESIRRSSTDAVSSRGARAGLGDSIGRLGASPQGSFSSARLSSERLRSRGARGVPDSVFAGGAAGTPLGAEHSSILRPRNSTIGSSGIVGATGRFGAEARGFRDGSIYYGSPHRYRSAFATSVFWHPGYVHTGYYPWWRQRHAGWFCDSYYGWHGPRFGIGVSIGYPWGFGIGYGFASSWPYSRSLGWYGYDPYWDTSYCGIVYPGYYSRYRYRHYYGYSGSYRYRPYVSVGLGLGYGWGGGYGYLSAPLIVSSYDSYYDDGDYGAVSSYRSGYDDGYSAGLGDRPAGSIYEDVDLGPSPAGSVSETESVSEEESRAEAAPTRTLGGAPNPSTGAASETALSPAEQGIVIGLGRMRAGDAAAAIDEFARVGEAAPGARVPQLLLGFALYANGDYAAAGETFASALVGWNDLPSIDVGLAKLYGRPEERDTQISRLEDWVGAHPLDPRAQLVRGVVLSASGQASRAAPSFEFIIASGMWPELTPVLAAYLEQSRAAAAGSARTAPQATGEARFLSEFQPAEVRSLGLAGPAVEAPKN
jgi:hypothetical protein